MPCPTCKTCYSELTLESEPDEKRRALFKRQARLEKKRDKLEADLHAVNVVLRQIELKLGER